ncbi:hypothetical protein Cgig2_010199 [Carnegiea gigantea]|uniref:Uncharacterized protein n=1 Tax=Carnegiea gigantea TaxID=171969 RepID=A0A9Q1JIH9_9CARY|nr:hypothetical protein Cgig2_010199 [Carnegiea gigantea]
MGTLRGANWCATQCVLVHPRTTFRSVRPRSQYVGGGANPAVPTKAETDNAPPESSKVQRALFDSNTSLNQVSRSPMLLKGLVEENSFKCSINGSSDTVHSSASSKRNDQLDASNVTSALSLRTLCSSQKRVPLETTLQQGEERETNIPQEEENHDMLDAWGNMSRTTVKISCVGFATRYVLMIATFYWSMSPTYQPYRSALAALGAQLLFRSPTNQPSRSTLAALRAQICICDTWDLEFSIMGKECVVGCFLGSTNQISSVNNFSQLDNNEARRLSSFIGVLARDPRIMLIDCIDFRKIGEDRIEDIWNIA